MIAAMADHTRLQRRSAVRRARGHDDERTSGDRVEGIELEHAVRRPGDATAGKVIALQQAAGNAAVAGLVQPATIVQRQEWGAKYKSRRARPGALPYDEYKARIGQPGESEKFAPALQAASEWGGHELETVGLSRTELGEILLAERPQDPDAVAGHEQRLDKYLPEINAAFEIMKIDTVEAQADYLAHAAGESGTLSKLTEVGADKRPYAPFQGRGPVQVTWEHGYVQTIAYLETRAEELAAQADQASAEEQGLGGEGGASIPGGSDKLRRQADVARRAVDAIKLDPAEAANSEYAFLFSAAFMQMAGGVRSSARLGQTAGFAGNSAEDRWVTGRSTSLAAGLAKALADKDTAAESDMRSTLARAKVKRETYARAVAVLWPRRREALETAP